MHAKRETIAAVRAGEPPVDRAAYSRRHDERCGFVGVANGRRGARFFSGRMPLRVVYHEPGHSRSSASRREAAIKKLSRRDKQSLIATQQS